MNATLGSSKQSQWLESGAREVGDDTEKWAGALLDQRRSCADQVQASGPLAQRSHFHGSGRGGPAILSSERRVILIFKQEPNIYTSRSICTWIGRHPHPHCSAESGLAAGQGKGSLLPLWPVCSCAAPWRTWALGSNSLVTAAELMWTKGGSTQGLV